MNRNDLLAQPKWGLGDLAVLLAVDRRTLVRDIEAERLPYALIGSRYFFTRSDVDQYLTPERAATILAPEEETPHAENQ